MQCDELIQAKFAASVGDFKRGKSATHTIVDLAGAEIGKIITAKTHQFSDNGVYVDLYSKCQNAATPSIVTDS